MRNFEIIEGNEENILSVKRVSDGVIFKVGDNVDLDFRVKEGVAEGKEIQKFMTETDRSHNNMDLYKTANPFPSGTIVTKVGVIEIPNAAHIEFDSDIYKIMNTPILTVKEVLKITNQKYQKTLKNIVKERLEL